MKKLYSILLLALLFCGCSKSEENSVVEANEVRTETKSEVMLYFINNTTQALVTKTEGEVKLFEAQESGNLKLSDEIMPILSIARKDQDDAKLVFQGRVFPSSTVTAYKDSNGRFRIKTERN